MDVLGSASPALLRPWSQEPSERQLVFYAVSDRIECGPRLPRHPFPASRIEEDKVRLNVLGCLMSFARIVLFTDEIVASRVQSALGRIGKVAVVIDYQDTRLFERFRGLWEKLCFDRSIHDFFRTDCRSRLPNLLAD